jgi:hypothetical protein
MKKLIPFIALFAFIFASCDTTPTPVEPQNSTPFEKAEQIRDVPVSAGFYNECCDEFVFVDAIAHIVVRDNGNHLTIKDLTGTGSNGNTYTGHNTAVQNVTSNSGNGASNFSLVVTTHLTNAAGCSFKLKIHLHTTTNADGTVTATVDSYEITCE